VNSVGASKRSLVVSMASSIAFTISVVSIVVPGSSLLLFSGRVASSAMATYRSRQSIVRSWSSSVSRAMARARPIAAWASSTAPYAWGSAEALLTLPP